MPVDTTSTIRVWVYASASHGDGGLDYGYKICGTKGEAQERALREVQERLGLKSIDDIEDHLEEEPDEDLATWVREILAWDGKSRISYEQTDIEFSEDHELTTQTFQISDRVLARMIG